MILSIRPGLQVQPWDSEDAGAKGQVNVPPGQSPKNHALPAASQSRGAHRFHPLSGRWWCPSFWGGCPGPLSTVLAPTPSPRASSPFCTAGLSGPHPGLFPSLKRPSPTGSVTAGENSQADPGGDCGLDGKGPQPRLDAGALVPEREAGSPSRPAPPLGAWAGRAPRGAPP